MIGTELSHFKITSKLGEGGMGEVYRATDTKLSREVAIKVLPESFIADPERLARFEREARVLASLNHTNIAGIFEVGESTAGGAGAKPYRFLAMELVEGDDLSERLARGPMSVDEATAIALQIARALEAAHESGVVHRDLKPSNVKVTEAGDVKVLDFGLAKAMETESGPESQEPPDSPTLMYQPTVAGALLGTAAYMSPEQARGRPVDKRTDIWAFGVVLWEMLVGRRLFRGKSASDVLAAVLREEVSFEPLPEEVPQHVRRLLARCLERDPMKRLRDMGEARIALESDPEVAQVRQRRPGFGWGRLIAAVVGAALAVAGLVWVVGSGVSGPVGSPRAPAPQVSFSFRLPDEYRLLQPSLTQAGFEVSPDGTFVVFSAQPESGGPRIFRRALDSMEIVPVEGGEGGLQPFLSPDGRWIGFFTRDGALAKVAAEGGLPERIHGRERLMASGAFWGSDDRIYYSRGLTGGIGAVPADGGEAVQVTTPDFDAGEIGHWRPRLLAGGEELMFGAWTVSGWRNRVLDLITGELRDLDTGGGYLHHLPTGHLLWLESRSLIAAPFALGPSRLLGRGRPVLSGITSFHVSTSGTLAYMKRSSARTLSLPARWSETEGVTMLEAGGPADQVRVAPGGRQLATTMIPHLWVADIDRGVRSPLTTEGVVNNFPVWSADGGLLAFNSLRAPHGLYVQSVDGVGEARLVLKRTSGAVYLPGSWSPDGRSVMVTELHPSGQADVVEVDLDSGSKTSLVATEAIEHSPAISPDGRWLAYTSNVSGRDEIYVQPYPGAGQRRTISTAGGTEPRWGHDGATLYFRVGFRIFAVPISTRVDDLDLDVPRMRAELPAFFQSTLPFAPVWDVTPNGDLIYLQVPPTQPGGDEIFVVHGWSRELDSSSTPSRRGAS